MKPSKPEVVIEVGSRTDGYRYLAPISGVVKTSKVYGTVEDVERALNFVFGKGRWKRKTPARVTRIAEF